MGEAGVGHTGRQADRQTGRQTGQNAGRRVKTPSADRTAVDVIDVCDVALILLKLQ